MYLIYTISLFNIVDGSLEFYLVLHNVCMYKCKFISLCVEHTNTCSHFIDLDKI